MGAAARGALWLWVAAIVGVGCAHDHARRPIRYGSLKVGDRSFTYSHGVEQFTLPNGLIVALTPDPRASLVAVDVRYRVGAAEDPPGKSGLAHLVEHLLFDLPGQTAGEGAQDEPGGPTLGDRLAAAALYHNADTGWDATHYREIALADRLPDLLAIERARMTDGCAGLTQAAFERERAVVIQELAQRGGSTLADSILGDLFGADHRYAAGVGGRDVAELGLDDVCRFIDAHYAPGRAILVVSGGFDPRATRTAIVSQFGALTRTAAGSRTPVPRVALTGATSEHRIDTERAAAIVVFPAATWGSREALDDQLIDALLVQRLSQLESEQPWITDTDAGALASRRAGARYFLLEVDNPARLDEAVAAIFRAASELPGDTPGLALGAIAALRRSQLFDQFESVVERGRYCAEYLQFTGHKRFHLEELAALQDIDVDRLRARAARMTRSASHVVRVVPTGHHSAAARPRLTAAAAAIDAPVWRSAVDPAEADQPLALPTQRAPITVSEHRLANGMRVVMAPDLTQPVFEARVVFPVGNFSGYLADAAAELLSHDDRRGYSIGDYATITWAMRLGSRLFTDVGDATTFGVRGTSTFADWHLWRLHWLLENGVYPERDVEHANQEAARPSQHRDIARGRARALYEALFGRDHPFIREAFAPRRELSSDDLDGFRDAYYRANQATLIVVGQLDDAALRRTATELFGAWPAEPPPPPRPIPPLHPAAGPTWIAHADPDAGQVRITVAFAATSQRVPARGGRAVVRELIHSRVEQARTRLAASYGISTEYSWSDAGDVVMIDGFVDPDRAGDVLRRMLTDLDELRRAGPELAADFVRARRTALAGSLAGPASSSSVADEIQSAVIHRVPIELAGALPAAIAETTLADARAAIAADLQASRMVVVLSGRPADTAAAFAAAGAARVQTVSSERTPAR